MYTIYPWMYIRCTLFSNSLQAQYKYIKNYVKKGHSFMETVCSEITQWVSKTLIFVHKFTEFTNSLTSLCPAGEGRANRGSVSQSFVSFSLFLFLFLTQIHRIHHFAQQEEGGPVEVLCLCPLSLSLSFFFSFSHKFTEFTNSLTSLCPAGVGWANRGF